MAETENRGRILVDLRGGKRRKFATRQVTGTRHARAAEKQGEIAESAVRQRDCDLRAEAI